MSPARFLRERALGLGFDAVGFARAPGPDEPFAEGLRFAEWLERGYAGRMAWLRTSAGQRAEPRALLPGLRSVVALGGRYPGVEPPLGAGEGRVARYARGRDYHNVFLRRVRKLLRALLDRYPEADGLSFVDRGAVLEKAWAVRAGLGWLGKNTLVLHPERGSYALIAILFLTLDLPPDPPLPDQCGACRLCLDACPTGAFPEPYLLDARRCISYLTIELKGDIPEELRGAIGERVFGCDVCQEVCPFNLRPLERLDPAFGPEATPLHEPLDGLLALDPEGFASLTRGRPLARPGREGLVRNACVAAGNSGDRRHLPALERLLGDPSPVVRRHAAWAIGRLTGGGEPSRPGPGRC